MLSFLIHYKFIVNSYLVNSQNSFPDHVLMLQSKWFVLKQAIKNDTDAAKFVSWYGADRALEIACINFSCICNICVSPFRFYSFSLQCAFPSIE